MRELEALSKPPPQCKCHSSTPLSTSDCTSLVSSLFLADRKTAFKFMQTLVAAMGPCVCVIGCWCLGLILSSIPLVGETTIGGVAQRPTVWIHVRDGNVTEIERRLQITFEPGSTIEHAHYWLLVGGLQTGLHRFHIRTLVQDDSGWQVSLATSGNMRSTPFQFR